MVKISVKVQERIVSVIKRSQPLTLAVLLTFWGMVLLDGSAFSQDRMEVPEREKLELVEPIVKEAVHAISASHPQDSDEYLKIVLDMANAETDSTKKFAILQLLLDQSIDQNRTSTAFKVVDAMATTFRYSANRSKIEIVQKVITTKKAPSDRIAILGLLISSVRGCIEDGDTQIAKDACVAASRSIPKEYKKEVSAYFAKLKKIAEGADAYTRGYADAKIKLVDSPDNQEANALVGKYEFQLGGEFSKIASSFVLSGDKLLEEIASLEAVGSKSPTEMKRLADLWWELAQKYPEGFQSRSKERAATWYSKSLKYLHGVDEVVAKSRIEESNTEDRFPFIKHDLLGPSTKRVIQNGVYDEKKRILKLNPADPSFCQFFQELPDEYDLEYRFKRTSGKYGFFFTFPSKGRPFTWSNGGHAHSHGGFHSFNALPGNDRASTAFDVAEGVTHTLLIKVRAKKFQCMYDGKIVSEVNDPFDPKVTRPNDNFHHTWTEPYIAVGDWWGALEIQSAIVTEYR
jgi:hypothetical protein